MVNKRSIKNNKNKNSTGLFKRLLSPGLFGVSLVSWCFIFLYVVVVSILCWQQYTHYIYGGYDLAIFDQVVWNTAHGRWFEYSFSTHSYLVDHRSFLLPLLVPLYWVISHPMVLLVVQTIGLAVGSIFIYHLARRVLKDIGHANLVGMIAVALYLMQPTLQCMNLFEFHMLTFVVPLSLALWLAVESQRWRIVFVLLAFLLLLREDIGLMTAGVGLLIIITQWKDQKRTGIKIGLIVTLVSAVWFLAMMYIGTLIAPEGVAKFFFMYDWMGDTPMQAVRFMILHPLQTLAVLGDFDHTVVVLFLLASVAFLPLFRVRYLLPALPQWILFLLVDQQMLWPILKSHYSAVILPWLLVAAIYGYKNLYGYIKRYIRKYAFFEQTGAQGALAVFICVLVLAQSFVIGPVSGLRHYFEIKSERDLDAYDQVVAMVEPDDVVIASSHIYTHLTEREQIYPDMHIFTGKVHFTDIDYPLPQNVDWIILEQEMILRWGIYLPLTNRGDAGQRFQAIIEDNQLVPVFVNEDLVVFGKQADGFRSVELLEDSVEQPLENAVDVTVNHILDFNSWSYEDQDMLHGQLRLLFERNDKQDVYKDDQHIQLTWKDINGGVLKQKIFALGYGLEPTHTWVTGVDGRRIVNLYITQPEQAASVELTIGTLDKLFGPFFSLWAADPIMNEEKQETILLPGIAPQDNSETTIAFSLAH